MIIPVGFAQVTHRFDIVGGAHDAFVTYGIGGGLLAPSASLPAELYDAWVDSFLPQQSSAVTLINTAVKFGPSATGPVFEFSSTGSGGGSTEMAPPNVAFLMRKATTQGGRTGRGRMYIPGVPEAAVNNGGSVSSGVLTALTNAGDVFLGGLDALNAPMVLLHQLGGSSDDTPHQVLSLTPSNLVATQRRRLRR